MLEQAEANPRLALLTQALAGRMRRRLPRARRISSSGIWWRLAKLHRATGDATYFKAVRNLWWNIREHHLTLGGGPWGGVGHRSREVFNPARVFSPFGYVETCSTMAWILLNRELLLLTGEAVYAEEIERSAYNDLLGAQGRTAKTGATTRFRTAGACTRRTGAAASRAARWRSKNCRLSRTAWRATAGIKVNLFGPVGRAAEASACRQRAREAEDGRIRSMAWSRFELRPNEARRLRVHVRIPEWAEGASVRVNEETDSDGAADWAYCRSNATGSPATGSSCLLPMHARVHRERTGTCRNRARRMVLPVSQEVLRFDYLAITPRSARLCDGI